MTCIAAGLYNKIGIYKNKITVYKFLLDVTVFWIYTLKKCSYCNVVFLFYQSIILR